MMDNKDLYIKESQKKCLITLSPDVKSNIKQNDVINQINFSILRGIHDYNLGFLSKDMLFNLVDKLDAYEYIIDLLDPVQLINKINQEIFVDIFNLRDFNLLCIPCPNEVEG